MAEVSAVRKHPCPECGGDAEWNAAKQALVCPYCGATVPWTPAMEAAAGDGTAGDGSPAGIREHPLDQALSSLKTSERGWGEAKTTVVCQSCRAISVFDAGRAAQRCEFCGSPSIVPQTSLPDAITPESLLPVAVADSRVRDLLREWYGSRWFAPNKLKRAALTDTLKGIYLPYWTFDARVHAEWTAQAGYHYYVTESYRDSNGQNATRQVQRTRWEPAAGSLDHFFDDALVPGTVGVHPDLLRQIEPFPTEDLKPYDPAYVRGWTVERYQLDLRQAAARNVQDMEHAVRNLCAAQVPGDTHSDLRVEAQYSGRTFKHILAPVYLVTYDYGARSFQVVVNGYTGTMAGERPYSWVKIAFAVVFALLVVLILFSLDSGS